MWADAGARHAQGELSLTATSRAAGAQAQTRYMEAVEKFGQVKEEVDALLTQRDDAYLELLAVPSPSGAPSPADMRVWAFSHCQYQPVSVRFYSVNMCNHCTLLI